MGWIYFRTVLKIFKKKIFPISKPVNTHSGHLFMLTKKLSNLLPKSILFNFKNMLIEESKNPVFG